jgi:hypothetical protein
LEVRAPALVGSRTRPLFLAFSTQGRLGFDFLWGAQGHAKWYQPVCENIYHN